MDRVNSYVFRDYPAYIYLNAYNNLFHGGSFTIGYYLEDPTEDGWSPSISLYDNLFENIAGSEYGQDLGAGHQTWSYFIYNHHNGYVNSAFTLVGSSGGDVVRSRADYQTGPLGRYYYPGSGTNLFALVNAGSRSAPYAGLYHYTTQTDQTKETNSVVDIGYHFVAVDGNSNPIDSDGDGIPDYLEDANGNGVVDNGETDWQSATALGLKVIITRPKNNSVIP